MPVCAAASAAPAVSLLLVKLASKNIPPWEMRLSSGKRSTRTLMAGIMLAAIASRMLIPPGFMPATGRPFLMEICWEDLSTDMLTHVEPPDADSVSMESMGMDPMPAHFTSQRGPLQAAHHHSGSPLQSEHCVFGTACGAGPIPHLPLPSDFSSAPQLRAVAFALIAVPVRVVHLPPPRAPPVRLI